MSDDPDSLDLRPTRRQLLAGLGVGAAAASVAAASSDPSVTGGSTGAAAAAVNPVGELYLGPETFAGTVVDGQPDRLFVATDTATAFVDDGLSGTATVATGSSLPVYHAPSASELAAPADPTEPALVVVGTSSFEIGVPDGYQSLPSLGNTNMSRLNTVIVADQQSSIPDSSASTLAVASDAVEVDP
jgi:hypothetical protein